MGFEIGQKLLYGVHGVCIVRGIITRAVDRKQVEYYELSPVEQTESRFYIPTGNPAAVAKLHPVMNRQELENLLDSVCNSADAWIPDENRRKLRYRELMSNLDRGHMLCMVSALLQHKQQQQAQGKKLHMCDESFLRDAQRLIAGEFSLVLGLPKEEIGEYIQKKLSL